MNFMLRGAALSITADDVLSATRDVSPTPTDRRNKYFLELHRRRFPIKQVVRLVTGLPSTGFTAQDAHRILTRLGFEILEGKARTLGNARTPDRADGDPTSVASSETTPRDNGEVCRLLVVFQTDEDGWEVASCPTLPGCHSQGRTREDALESVREAISGYLASLREHAATLPPSSEYQIVEVRA